MAHRTVRRREGQKGPTFFADVSQVWRKRVLTVDPVGVDPRMAPATRPPDLTAIRHVLATLATFAVRIRTLSASRTCAPALPRARSRPAAAKVSRAGSLAAANAGEVAGVGRLVRRHGERRALSPARGTPSGLRPSRRRAS
jgi:hypothetical protein